MNMAELKEAGTIALGNSLQSSICYINKLQELGCSKLCLIRLDLLATGIATKEQIEVYLTHLRTVIRQQYGAFAHCLGLIRTAPIQEEDQYRIQCVFMFDGERVQRDIKHGHEIGCYWVNIITEGYGSYCNYNQYQQLAPQNGYGVTSLVTTRWKCYKLLMSIGCATHPLIIVGITHKTITSASYDS